ncbi:transcriptional regulator [Catellatospora sp. IY07-71]|uniref:ArsR/SmtB family transcription factor n=1 Tax=Catellatospora sp. IY07-71 TaxID=2728827 RepID=UPI001BB30863|nr:helix-turn-helix domain-containing protein [Catellatospora sp. IY07-71]BCJ77279.1 transcriptional regulator [Catellatospora sp. IY07-71]
MKDDASSISLDPRTLRGLAHPVRVQMLGMLRERGPSTATLLAAQLGLSSAATSYHLRQLAQHGFIVEDTDRGNARERWWRAAHRRTTVSDVAPESYGDFEIYLRAVTTQYAARVDRAISEYATRPEQWVHVGTFSDWSRRLTPEETTAMQDELIEVINRYRPDEPEAPAPGDAARVVVQLQVMPFPQDPS